MDVVRVLVSLAADPKQAVLREKNALYGLRGEAGTMTTAVLIGNLRRIGGSSDTAVPRQVVIAP